MRFLFTLLCASFFTQLCWGAGVGGSGGSGDVPFPPCILPCALQAGAAAGCTMIDPLCLCSSQRFIELAGICGYQSCSEEDAKLTNGYFTSYCAVFGYPPSMYQDIDFQALKSSASVLLTHTVPTPVQTAMSFFQTQTADDSLSSTTTGSASATSSGQPSKISNAAIGPIQASCGIQAFVVLLLLCLSMPLLRYDF